MNKTMLTTIAATVLVLAVIHRVPKAREALTGDAGGWFSW